MNDDFEDHCWKDIVTPDVLEIYAAYRRKTFVGPTPALLAVDLYELVYRGGAEPPAKLAKSYPNACGEYAYAAIEPTKRLFAAARAAGLPIFYSTGDVRSESRPSFVTATKRNKPPTDPSDYAIRPEFKPQPGDVVITKQRASVFFGTPLLGAPDPARHPDADHLRRKHVGLRAGDRGRCLFARLSRRAGRGMLLRPLDPVAQGQPVRHAPQVLRRDAPR